MSFIERNLSLSKFSRRVSLFNTLPDGLIRKEKDFFLSFFCLLAFFSLLYLVSFKTNFSLLQKYNLFGVLADGMGGIIKI